MYGYCNRCQEKGRVHPLLNPHIKKAPNVLLCNKCYEVATSLVLKWTFGGEWEN